MASYNVELNYLNEQGEYDILYPITQKQGDNEISVKNIYQAQYQVGTATQNGDTTQVNFSWQECSKYLMVQMLISTQLIPGQQSSTMSGYFNIDNGAKGYLTATNDGSILTFPFYDKNKKMEWYICSNRTSNQYVYFCYSTINYSTATLSYIGGSPRGVWNFTVYGIG